MFHNENRRQFLKSTLVDSIAACAAVGAMTAGRSAICALPKTGTANKLPTFEEYVRGAALSREVVDVFLKNDSWAKFDPELGYILGNHMPRDGVDGSFTISTAQPQGTRTSQIYQDRPCRINTYGDSFTQCHQVSDGETWQEYLAAHLGEPIRNFGMGGYGLYQAYRRMLREEQTDNSAKNIVFYMWGDDYFRSLLRCRYLTYYGRWNDDGGYMFHGNFWCNIEMDLSSGKLVERESLIRKESDMYRMTDPDFLYQSVRDDLGLQLHLLASGSIDGGIDEKRLRQLAERLDVPPIDFSSPDPAPAITRLRNAYGFAATRYILDGVRKFAKENDKQVLIVHLDPNGVLRPLLEGKPRYDQEVVDYVKKSGLRYFDMNEVHVRDFADFKLSINDYMKRYFIGHYSPAGNHFFAHAIKHDILEMLDPKPITYRSDEGRKISFEGYLPD